VRCMGSGCVIDVDDIDLPKAAVFPWTLPAQWLTTCWALSLPPDQKKTYPGC